MKRLLPLALAGLLFAGVASACDDAPRGRCDKVVDQDDCRLGPGDGINERGPLR